MTKRVFIGVGHGGKDPGAVKYVKESEANLQMALGMKEELEKYGITVGISRTREENDPLSEEIREANAFKPDIAVEVHNNAGGGDGFEVYRQTNGYAEQSLKLARCIETRVKASGQKSRGVKTKLNSSGTDYFGWCRQVQCPAVLCEGFFVDNLADSADYTLKPSRKPMVRFTLWVCWIIWESKKTQIQEYSRPQRSRRINRNPCRIPYRWERSAALSMQLR